MIELSRRPPSFRELMQMATVQDTHIEKLDGQPARLARLPRIRVAQIVMDYMAHGWSPEEISRHQTHVNLAEAHAAMSYYYDHQSEIDDEIRREIAANRSDRDGTPMTPIEMRLRALGRL